MSTLLVKLSSMGDVIHTLPALTDAQQANPAHSFTWVIDESFADIGYWHPAVTQVIPTAHRRWRINWWAHWKNGEIPNTIKTLRQQHYDLIIDAQANIKSALVASFAKGPSVGLDWRSARESICSIAYRHRYAIDKNLHAITRIRQLFAKALNYPLPSTPPTFNIDITRLKKPDIELPNRYLLFVPNASWTSKLWPAIYWQRLLKLAVDADYYVLIPQGNAEEALRAKKFSELAPQKIIALPKLTLSNIAYIAKNAVGAVSVDTGLGHLLAAFDIPTINLYGATDAKKIGTVGKNQQHLQADFSCSPCYFKNCQFKGEDIVSPACYTQLTPEKIWNALCQQLKLTV